MNFIGHFIARFKIFAGNFVGTSVLPSPTPAHPRIKNQKSKIFSLFLPLILLFPTPSNSQPFTPELASSTFLGGSVHDSAYDIATDSEGNLYIVGATSSPFIATPGAFRPWYSGANGYGGGDGFIAKFDPTGRRLLFLTYLGGTGNDSVAAIAIGPDGNVYVAGVTDSTDFPLRHPLKPFISGQPDPYDQNLYPYDIFVAVLNPSGSELLYSTYLGGSGRDQATDIALDSQGAIYITGFTESGNFPRSRFSQPLRGNSDAYVLKLGPGGRSYVYSRLLGGSSNERGQSIAIDSQNNVFLTGYTHSSNFPVATNAFQPTWAGGRDVFLTTLDPDGALTYSTYLGGGGDDVGYRIALDPSGIPVIAGTHSGIGFPITPNPLNPGGVFLSLNQGASWQPVNAGLLHNEIQSLAINPFNPAILYTGTRRGVARSTNNAASWQLVLHATADTRAIAVDPFDTAVVYADTAGLRKSTNNGLTWDRKSRGLPAAKIARLLPDPLSPGTLYAATGAGLYKTTNSADAWRFSGRGMGSPAVYDLALNPLDNSSLFAGTSVGVYRSTNAGASWFPARKGIGSITVRSLALDPATPDTAYAGTSSAFYKTLDAGSNWFRVPFNQLVTTTVITTNTIITTNLDILVTNFVVLTNTIVSTNVLARNASVRAIAVDPSNPDTLYAGTARGLLKSIDAGLFWQTLTNGLAVSNITTLLLHPQDPSILYAGTDGISGFGGTDAFVARFGPDYASVILGGSGVDQAWDLAIDPQGNTFVVGTTVSRNFPVRNLDLSTNAPPTLSPRNRGGYDAFVTAFKSDSSAFLYSGYLGGRGNDRATALVVDPSGNVSLTGATSSQNFPAFLPFKARISGATDAFLTRLLLTPTE